MIVLVGKRWVSSSNRSIISHMTMNSLIVGLRKNSVGFQSKERMREKLYFVDIISIILCCFSLGPLSHWVRTVVWDHLCTVQCLQLVFNTFFTTYITCEMLVFCATHMC